MILDIMDIGKHHQYHHKNSMFIMTIKNFILKEFLNVKYLYTVHAIISKCLKDYRSKVYLFLSEIARADIPGYRAEQYKYKTQVPAAM